MTNILNNGDANDLNPDDTGADKAINPGAPTAPALHPNQLGEPTAQCEPEGTVGTGLNPP